MEKHVIISDVNNGEFKRNKGEITNALKSFEGKTIKLTIEKFSNKRSINQNNFYWGILISIAKQGIYECWAEQWSNENIHKMLLDVCPIYREVINKKTGEIISVKKTSSEMTTIEMNQYWEQCRKYLAENFYVNVPEPKKI